MKMNVDQKVVSDIPIEMVDNILNIMKEDDWFADSYRDSAGNMENTNSIPIFHTPLCVTGMYTDDAIKDITKCVLYDKYFPVIEPILNLLKQHYEFRQYAAFLTRCYPKKVIGEHSDQGNFLELCNRIHIPIQTNKKAMYIIDGNSYHWEKGKIYEFDNMRRHSVYNGGDDHRIHMIINLYNLARLPATI